MKIESEHDKKLMRHLNDVEAEEEKKRELLDKSHRRNIDLHPSDKDILKAHGFGSIRTDDEKIKEANLRTWEEEKAEVRAREERYAAEDGRTRNRSSEKHGKPVDQDRSNTEKPQERKLPSARDRIKDKINQMGIGVSGKKKGDDGIER